ncbi:MAG: hypothetical protein IJP07_01250 [Firmicutes bacterium]|nr:hypothetical protein [Bacillota bacterium]
MSIHVYRPEGALFEDSLAWEEEHLLDERLYRDDMLRLLGEQSAYVIHELRSPLQAISAQLQVLRQLLRRDMGERHELRFDLVFDEMKRMDSMMDQFLQLGSLQQPQVAPVCLVELCRQCTQIMRSLAIRRRVELLVDDDLELPMVQADQHKLRQILINLITNGMDACTERGQGPGQIFISIRESWGPQGSSQLIQVRDNGCGIPENCMDRLFELYFTTKEKGNGLGLALSRKFAQAQGGDLWAENNSDGPGASFFLRVPSYPF